MDLIEEIKIAVAQLDKIEEYSNLLPQKLSELDLKEQDLLHYIEKHKINVLWCYRMIKQIKTVREERRNVKHDMELLTKFNENKTKLLSKDNRQFLLAEIHKKEKTLGKNYTNKYYTEEELENILKGV